MRDEQGRITNKPNVTLPPLSTLSISTFRKGR